MIFLAFIAYLFAAGVAYASVMKVFLFPRLSSKAILVAASLMWGVIVPIIMVSVCVWSVFRVAEVAVDKAAVLLEEKDDNDGS